MLKLFKNLRPDAPLTYGKAYTCALLNQLAMPGAGSMVGGRFLTGAFQMVTAATGFVLGSVSFMKLMANYYALIDLGSSAVPVDSGNNSLGVVGAGLFVFSWFWALFTSGLILKQAGQLERARMTPSVLPPSR